MMDEIAIRPREPDRRTKEQFISDTLKTYSIIGKNQWSLIFDAEYRDGDWWIIHKTNNKNKKENHGSE
jgi:hypothetical protein